MSRSFRVLKSDVAARKLPCSASRRTRIAVSRTDWLSLSDSQSVRDTAILVRRLAEQGSFRAATSLLSTLKERDMAKVLSTVSNTNPQMALRLSEALQAARQLSTERQ